jgi:hypothetical protein
MPTPFDTALANTDLRAAAIDYARRAAAPGTPEYHAAWLKFRQNIRTTEDLRRWRTRRLSAAERPAANRSVRERMAG